MRARPLLATLLLIVASLPVHAAGAGSMAVTAVVISKSNCKFRAGAMALNFGTINPSSTGNATASATATFKCAGSSLTATFLAGAGNGLHFSGSRRVQHTTQATEFMAYSLALSPTSATVPKNVDQTLTVTGTIVPTDFQNAASGNYSDTVIITLTP